MGTPDAATLLESAGKTFLRAAAYGAAAGLFALVTESRAHDPNPWYGLGNAYAMESRARDPQKLLPLAVRCLRRSLLEGPDHSLSSELLGVLTARAGIPPAVLAACTPFDGSLAELLAAAGLRPELLVEATRRLPDWRERMVMALGDSGLEAVGPVLIEAVVSDPNADVKMAALEGLVRSGAWRVLEPYASMALRRVDAPWARGLLTEMAG